MPDVAVAITAAVVIVVGAVTMAAEVITVEVIMVAVVITAVVAIITVAIMAEVMGTDTMVRWKWPLLERSLVRLWRGLLLAFHTHWLDLDLRLLSCGQRGAARPAPLSFAPSGGPR